MEREMDRAEGRPIRWGVTDCVRRCSNVIWRALAQDMDGEFRHRYFTRKSAYRLIGPVGLAMRLHRRSKALGWKAIDPLAAQPGDVGIAPGTAGQATVLKYRDRFWLGWTDGGFVLLDESKVRVAWSVTG